MKRSVRATLLAACAAVVACESSGSWGRLGGPAGDGPGGSSVEVSIAIAGDVCGIVSADATVTGTGMLPVGPVPLAVSGATIEGVVTGVPAGSARSVSVSAYDARGLAVYAGTVQVDVVAGQTAPASVVLSRTGVACGGPTGAIAVTGTIGPAPFRFTDATLSSDGILHFFDAQADRIRRLDVASRTFLSDVAASPLLDAGTFAVAPDGSVAYLGYAGGRIDVVDLATGTPSFFAAAASTVTSMIVAGGHLFTIDSSGAWATDSLYDRTTRARVYAADWAYAARSIVYSAARSRVYLLDSGVSPTDVHMIAVDHLAGTLGADVGSPYHGDYSLPSPIRLLPDESGVIVGSGLIFEAADLTYRTSIGLSFQDVAFLGDRIYLVDTVGELTQVRVLSSSFDLLAADYFPGQALRVFARGGELVLVTRVGDEVTVSFLAP